MIKYIKLLFFIILVLIMKAIINLIIISSLFYLSIDGIITLSLIAKIIIKYFLFNSAIFLLQIIKKIQFIFEHTHILEIIITKAFKLSDYKNWNIQILSQLNGGPQICLII